MPPVPSDPVLSIISNSTSSSVDGSNRRSYDKTISGVFTYTNGTDVETGLPDHRLEQIKNRKNGSQNSLNTGYPANTSRSRDRIPSSNSILHPLATKSARPTDEVNRTSTPIDSPTKLSDPENTHEFSRSYGLTLSSSPTAEDAMPTQSSNRTGERDSHVSDLNATVDGARNSFGSNAKSPVGHPSSAPSTICPLPTTSEPQTEPIKVPQLPKLVQRHTLQVPQHSGDIIRASREFSYTSGPSEEVLANTGRFSPTRDSGENNVVRRRRASLGLVRRSTRAASDVHLEEVPPDEDAARWTEAIKQKRASRRRRREEEEEEDNRVVVGKKVEEGHVNWVTAYNMLTGIRFTVSRINAKLDRELTDADFDAKHKLSFDVTGHELTPSAKYDFKFKDYAPWVFRHLRQIFGLDPADYLMSLTSKYILSELGSPGKSGSFFYFSRDYKYIIKTIHHAEHKLLRKILRDYYHHVKDNPNTLISQFYGLHRVKVAFGRKIHFVVMNNLFPPHRDIHQTFDLKGSTIGRDFKEEELSSNPRATLKDLNWLRRDLHLEFDHRTREIFVKQLQKDVALLQRLQIMDYSLLVGMHDLEKGNDENVREKTLQVFQPGGEKNDDELAGSLMRTPSRLESARKARELRQNLKKEKPVPMGLSNTKMPENMTADDRRQNRIFYSDDGGIRATHEDGRPGDLVYYLGVIDCLTHYGFIKHLEHFWKGLSSNGSQISAIPPIAYGERFLNFITGVTMTKEEAQRRATQEKEYTETNAHSTFHHHHHHDHHHHHNIPPRDRLDVSADGALHSPRNEYEVEKTLDKAQMSADKQTSGKGRRRSEEDVPDRTLMTYTTEARLSTTLPIVQEAGEGSSRQSSRSEANRSHTEANHQAEDTKQVQQSKLTDQVFENEKQFFSPKNVSDEDLEGQRRSKPGQEHNYKHDQKQDQDHDNPDDHNHHPVEYLVTSDDCGHGKAELGEMEAPMSTENVNEVEIWPTETQSEQKSQRISKPPRIDSSIIPTMGSLLGEDEIGVAQ